MTEPSLGAMGVRDRVHPMPFGTAPIVSSPSSAG